MKLIQGDCLIEMENIPDKSIDLIFTSPPYADRREKCYNSVSSDKYIEWFKPMAVEFKRILKSTGSFFLNIKPHTDNGERSLYVMELVIALKKEIGFNFMDELCWTKNAFPGKHNGRFKNGFEPIYHFTKGDISNIIFNPTACGTLMKEESIARTYRKQCGPPKNGSGMTGMNTTNIRNLEFARPSNVININNVSNQFDDKQKHPATFPEDLVDFFIKSFTNENDLVMDPFLGSGTTGIVSKKLGRDFIGIELDPDYFKIAEKRINKAVYQPELFTEEIIKENYTQAVLID